MKPDAQPRPERLAKLTRAERIAIGVPLGVATVIVGLIVVGFIVLVVLFAVAWSPGKDLINASTSPTGRWTARAYYHDPGAAASAWVTVEVSDNTGKQATSQIASLDEQALASDAVWAGDNKLRMVWKAGDTLTIGTHDYSVVQPWWRRILPRGAPEYLLFVGVPVATAIGYWYYRIRRRKSVHSGPGLS